MFEGKAEKVPWWQIDIIQVEGKHALIYRESNHGRIPTRITYCFCLWYYPWCFVVLLYYLFLEPKGSYHCPRFYVQIVTRIRLMQHIDPLAKTQWEVTLKPWWIKLAFRAIFITSIIARGFSEGRGATVN